MLEKEKTTRGKELLFHFPLKKLLLVWIRVILEIAHFMPSSSQGQLAFFCSMYHLSLFLFAQFWFLFLISPSVSLLNKGRLLVYKLPDFFFWLKTDRGCQCTCQKTFVIIHSKSSKLQKITGSEKQTGDSKNAVTQTASSYREGKNSLVWLPCSVAHSLGSVHNFNAKSDIGSLTSAPG